jgi:alpha-tubulin suppressor-like RCC1 family protein
MRAVCLRWALAVSVVLLLGLAGVALGDQNESADRPLQHAAMSAGGSHTCAIDLGGIVSCWGGDAAGQLGDGGVLPGVPRPSPVPAGLAEPARVVAAGGTHTCAVLAGGAVRCWGGDASGQLGDGDPKADAAAPVAAVLLGGLPARAVTAGGSHSCALLADGSVRCWGQGLMGQLGLGAVPDASSPEPPVALGQPAIAVTAGRAHTCALLADGGVRCWGNDELGQLGDGGPLAGPAAGVPATVALGEPARAISAGADFTCALLASGLVRCWGADDSGQLGDGATSVGGSSAPAAQVVLPGVARAISAGGEFACALLANGAVWCWGADGSGQLGDGGPVPGPATFAPTAQAALPGPARAVTAGALHACALLGDGTLRCWGGDGAGALGDGDPFLDLSAPGAAVMFPGLASADSADLAVIAQASVATVRVGQPVVIVVTVANLGVDAATTEIAAKLGAGLGLVTATPSKGSYAEGTGRWSTGSLAPGDSAILTLAATGAAPATSVTIAEVAVSTALDPDSTPGDGAPGQDDRATVNVTVTPASADPPKPPNGGSTKPPTGEPSPTGKVAPGQLTLRLVPDRDPKAPYVFAARGRLIIPGAAGKRACSGTVTVTARRGKRPALVRRVKLRNAAGACNYSARLAFARRPARELKVSARFAGNARLTAKSSRAVRALLGPAARRRA